MELEVDAASFWSIAYPGTKLTEILPIEANGN